MATINKQNYVERKTYSKKNSRAKSTKRDWWLVKAASSGTIGVVYLRDLCLPEKFIGKRIKLKVELMDGEKRNIFNKGIVTGGIMVCNKCKKRVRITEEVYTDGLRRDYDLCKKCYLEEIR